MHLRFDAASFAQLLHVARFPSIEDAEAGARVVTLVVDVGGSSVGRAHLRVEPEPVRLGARREISHVNPVTLGVGFVTASGKETEGDELWRPGPRDVYRDRH